MFKPYELIAMTAAAFLMLVSLWLTQTEQRFAELWQQTSDRQAATPGVLVVGENGVNSINQAVRNSVSEGGLVQDLIINDIEAGTGPVVKEGSLVTVHYIGTLPDGQEFANSRAQGEPLTFTFGANEVMEGWEKGMEGMREGGRRIIVIPPSLGPDNQGNQIPDDVTLVFAIEILEIK